MRFTYPRALVVILIAGLATAGILWSSETTDTEASTTRVMPTTLHPDTSRGTALIWVITRDAYTSCQQPAYALRHVMANHGDVSLVVWYREYDGDIVDRILTRERLFADTAALDVQAYEKWLGHPPKPALHLVKDRRLVKSWKYTDHPIRVDDVTSLL